MRIIIILFMLVESMYARVNPFFPSKDSDSIAITTNTPEQHPSLKSISLVLPSSARVIKEVSIAYVNIDGSEERKTVAVDNSIDWHLPIVVSQSGSSSTNIKNIPVQVKNDNSFREIGSFKNISFYAKNKTLKIDTKDKYIQNFLIVSPHRIVVDFKGDYDFRSLTKNVSNSVFKSIKIGNHDGYYRVVIELDGQYKYNFSQEKESYIINLH